jgi:hypothetical protein
MANDDAGFGKRFQIFVLIVAVIALILPVLHIFKVLKYEGKDEEPGSRRYDRITFMNASEEPVRDVRVKLYDDKGGMWWDCPAGGPGSGGYSLVNAAVNLQPGESVTWVFNHEDAEGDYVVRAVCELEYDNPTANPVKPFIATCEIAAYTGFALNTASFWFGHPHDAGGVSNPDRQLCGQAVMSGSGSNPTPYVLPHSQAQQYPKP